MSMMGSPSPGEFEAFDKSSRNLYKFLPIVASIAIVLTGCLVLIGWLSGLSSLQQILPDLPKMTVNTAITFVLAGASLWLYSVSSEDIMGHSHHRRLAQILAAFVTLIALLTLSEYLFNWDAGLDQLLLKDETAVTETSIPGRPSPHTALAFTLIGLSLLLIRGDSPQRHWLAQYLAITAAFVALLALVGYIFSIPFLFRISVYTGMALHTALSFIVLCAGFLFLHPARSFMALMTTSNLGGIMARRLLLVAISVPLLVGWLGLLGEQAGLYSPQFAPILLAVLSAYVYSGAIWWYAHALNQIEADRKQAEKSLRESEEQTRLIIEGALDAVIIIDTKSTITGWNARAEAVFGWSSEEILGHPIDIILPSQYRESHHRGMQHFLATGEEPILNQRLEITALDHDRTEFPVELIISPIRMGDNFFFSVFVRDITEHKRAEAEIDESLRREQAARVEAELAQQRLAFLAEASNTLASSLDYQATLAAVAQLAVPRIADWCAVDVVEPSGSLSRVAVVHTDPAKVELAYELQRRYPPDPNEPSGVYRVLRSGQAEFYPEISESMLKAANLNDEQLRIIRRLGLISAITVPMLVRDRAFGVITFVSAESERHYTEADLALAEELAGRAALAVDNARLYHEVKKANEELEARVKKRTAQLETTNAALEHEISQRQKAEEELRRHRQELQDYIDSMSTLSAKVALDGTLLLANKIAQQASGVPLEVLMKTNFLEGGWWAFDPEVQNRVRQAFQQACTGIPVNYDEQIFVFGQVLTINFSLVPVTGSDGQIAYIVAEGRDVTALKQAERALQERSNQLEAANKELETFAYSVSHDLRAPLRSIDGFSQALLEDYNDSLDAEAQHYLQRVRVGSQRMAQLIDDLLMLSRLTRSEMRLESVNLSTLAQTIATELCQAEPERQVQFTIAPDMTVQADKRLIRVALENLLSNAWKFTSNQPVAHIEFGVWPQPDGHPAYFVRDDGAGFDMTYADKLFGAFQRLHSPTEFSGTGIGLATVQRIVHRHGGRVWAEGAIAQGASFYFVLDSSSKLEVKQ